ncbi:fimbrial protein [uncultured Pseudomonas sp.]|uniref:fimbrial protein n=1 Tax=uncultured Pseudomonas sp. TaxID=114707 RepID=UPI00258BE096|nr:fimbrial protein [uncultured Pseudomonas sp.]
MLTKLLIVMLSLTLSMAAAASCTQTGAAQTEDNRTAIIPFGRINITDTHLQPVGTLLGSVVVPPTNYTFGGANASTVLWTCAQTDLPSLYFLVATNGDDRIGGFWETGAADGLSGVYATWFEYIGLRQVMQGVTLTRYWQRVPVTTYAVSGNNIQIRLQDIPALQAEIYKISSLPPTSGAASNFCGNMGAASAGGTNYSCIQPNSYIQLVGPGLTHDNIGEDSAYRYNFWGVDNGFGYGMRTGSSLSQNATCVARTATPLVLFQSISAQQLQEGAEVQANFNVQIECSDAAVSGVNSGQVAIGIQASPSSFNAAKALGLVNSSGGISALVSDNYGNDSTLASGVGITVRNSTSGVDMLFVGQPGLTGNTDYASYPSGSQAGWYPVLQGASRIGASISGYSYHMQSYTAKLSQLPGRLATPGKVKATAYVLVKIQ